MTTTITIATQTPQGATVTASKSTEDDEAAQQVFALVADSLGSTGTAQQRLQAVTHEAARLLVQRARNYNRDLKAQEAVADEPGITLG